MHRRATALVAGVLAIVLAGCGAPSPPPSPTSTPPSSAFPVPSGWKVTFDDEFDGRAGKAPDSRYWHPDHGGTGWGNQELQYYTPSGNAFLDGQGHLVLEARTQSGGIRSCWYGPCRYTSGKEITYRGDSALFSQRYGHFEVRMKMPEGAGLLAAFWLLGDNINDVGYPESGEIDVVETLGNQTGAIEQHAHAPGLDFGSGFPLPTGQSISDWHTYAVTWTPTEIDWEVDGQTTQTLTEQQAASRWDFDHPFYLLFSLAVGGNWPGPPDAGTQFPARMLIDYVRVFDKAS